MKQHTATRRKRLATRPAKSYFSIRNSGCGPPTTNTVGGAARGCGLPPSTMPDPNRTPESPSPPSRPVPARPAATPDVIVEFLLEGDTLFCAVRNIGVGCAHGVQVKFAPEFRGGGGTLLIPSLALFGRLRFLAPGREIRALVDWLGAYFARNEPEVIDVSISYRDDAGRQYRRRLSHDLGVFRDLPRPGKQ